MIQNKNIKQNYQVFTVDTVIETLNAINKNYNEVLQVNAVRLAKLGLFKCIADNKGDKGNTLLEIPSWSCFVEAIEKIHNGNANWLN